MKTVCVFITDGFEDIEAFTPIDLLRRAGAVVKVVSLTKDPVTSSHGVRVFSDITVEEAGRMVDSCDMAVLPGGLENSRTLAASKDVKNLVTTVHAAGGFVAAICASPALALGSWGLVDGKAFTCYPGMGLDLDTKPDAARRVIRDGNIITACAAGASEEFSLALVTALFDEQVCNKLKADIAAR